MRWLLFPFLIFAAIGLIVSVAAHVGTFFDQGLPADATWWLHIGCLTGAFLPTMFVWPRLVGDYKGDDWPAAFRGCPVFGGLAFLIAMYAVVNFGIFIFGLGPPAGGPIGDPATPGQVRLMSGHWMVFYAFGAGTLWSAFVVAKRDPARHCPNGHLVWPPADSCKRCGADVGPLK